MNAVEFVHDSESLAGMTNKPKWDEWETAPSAKAIGRTQWREAIAIAGIVAIEMPHIQYPTPGADPDGYPWLTWAMGDDEFRLAVRPSALHAGGRFYEWDVFFDGCRRGSKSAKLNEVLEAMSATFPKVTS